MNNKEIIEFWGKPAVFGSSVVAAGTLAASVYFGIGVMPWTIAALIVKYGEAAYRSYATTRDLSKSIDTLQKENENLKFEIKRFEEMVGLLGRNVEDLEETKSRLFHLYELYKEENQRYESNNLLTLFGLVDKNEDSRLDQNEIERMKEYIRIVYKEEFDFDTLDKNEDGSISLKEFFNKFRKHKDD